MRSESPEPLNFVRDRHPQGSLPRAAAGLPAVPPGGLPGNCNRSRAPKARLFRPRSFRSRSPQRTLPCVRRYHHLPASGAQTVPSLQPHNRCEDAPRSTARRCVRGPQVVPPRSGIRQLLGIRRRRQGSAWISHLAHIHPGETGALLSRHQHVLAVLVWMRVSSGKLLTSQTGHCAAPARKNPHENCVFSARPCSYSAT